LVKANEASRKRTNGGRPGTEGDEAEVTSVKNYKQENILIGHRQDHQKRRAKKSQKPPSGRHPGLGEPKEITKMRAAKNRENRIETLSGARQKKKPKNNTSA